MSGMDRLTDEALLPCPFCGGPANGIVLFKMGAVLCDDCGYAIDRNKAPEAIAAWNRRASQAAPALSDGLREAWHKTTDELPKKPGLKSYEQIECLIKLPNGDLEISMWNCEYEVWDDAEGDDYRHDPCKPTHWMDLAPFRAALSASPVQEGGE